MTLMTTNLTVCSVMLGLQSVINGNENTAM